METSKSDVADVIVIGAGLAGTAAASVLGQQGRRVVLVDPWLECPPLFKAEKIDQQQVRLLESLGLLKHLIPHAGRVREVRVGYDGHVIRTVPIEQYGLSYSEMVNALRRHLPSSVDLRQARVEEIANSSDVQRVRLSTGEELKSRLVVLASGSSSHLNTQLGLRRQVIQRDQSLVFGFNVAPPDRQLFDFDSVTYYSLDPSARIDYLTLFRFRRVMRANLFVFRSERDPWGREFIQDPEGMLRRYLPDVTRVTGDFRVVSKVESGRVDLYRVESKPQSGIVLIGDACQSVCPSTGVGLDKVLTDVSVLAECVPSWLSSPGIDSKKLAEFYEHPRKLAVDSQAMRSALHHRRTVVDGRMRWRIHRFLLHLRWKIYTVLEALRRANKKVALRGASACV